MGRSYELVLTQRHKGSVVISLPSSNKIKECMKNFGWNNPEDVKGFVKYLFDKKFITICRLYLSDITETSLSKLTPEDMYLLSFVSFDNIKYSRDGGRLSFFALDFFPGDYKDQNGKILPRYKTKTKEKQLSSGEIVKIVVRHGNVRRISHHILENDWIVEIINSRMRSTGKRNYKKTHVFMVDPPLNKYIKYYIAPHISENTPEGKILKKLYGV